MFGPQISVACNYMPKNEKQLRQSKVGCLFTDSWLGELLIILPKKKHKKKQEVLSVMSGTTFTFPSFSY